MSQFLRFVMKSFYSVAADLKFYKFRKFYNIDLRHKT